MRIGTWRIACAWVLLGAGLALGADPGDLDVDFGTGGILVTDGGLGEAPFAVALQSDGLIVVGGPARDASVGHEVWFVSRYGASGTLDASYGQAGFVWPFAAHDDEGQALLDMEVDGADRVVATGHAQVGVEVVSGKGKKRRVETVWERHCVVVRLDTSGSLDTTFGDAGVAVVDTGLDRARGSGVLVLPDGRIVVSGSGKGSTSAKGKKGKGGLTGNDVVFVARLHPDGTLDATFGDAGVRRTNEVDGVDLGNALGGLAMQSDGSLVVAGADEARTSRWLIHRYDPDGALDTSFGLVTLDGDAGLADLVVDGMDRVYAAGTSSIYAPHPGDSGIVVRYHADGALDTSFGVGGIASLSGSDSGTARRLAVDDGVGVYVFGEYDATETAYLARLDSSGLVDAFFGAMGFADPLPLAVDHEAKCLAVSTSGDIVVAGHTSDGSHADRDLYVASYVGGP